MDLFIYFDITANIVKNKPVVKFHLKQEFKEGKQSLKKGSGQPISGAQVEYYTNYLGEGLGEQVYSERKKHFGLGNSCKFAVDNGLFTLGEKEIVNQYLIDLKNKTLANHTAATSTDSYKENLKKGSVKSKAIRTKQGIERWKNKDWKENQMNVMFSPDALVKRDKSFQKYFKENRDIIHERTFKRNTDSPWVLDNLRQSSKKNYSINGVKMNSIEYIMADLLTSLNIDWVYEKKFTVGNVTFIPDFYLTEYNTVIECYGDYWHAHPKKFLNELELLPSKRSILEVRAKDVEREVFFVTNGIQFLFFWESDLIKNIEKIKQTLIKQIKNGTTN